MPTARWNVAVAVVNGKIHVIGGSDGTRVRTEHEVYDPVANTWVTKKPLPVAITQAAAVAYSNYIYFVGGDTVGGSMGAVTATNYMYDDTNDNAGWTAKKVIPTARASFGVAIIGQSIYAIGGHGNSGVTFSTNEVYDITSNIWTVSASVPTARSGVAAVVGGKISVIGGNPIFTTTAGSLSTNEEYDPVLNVWNTRPPMPKARNSSGCVAVNNSIYVFGGTNSNSTALATNEVYTPGKVYYVFVKN